MKRTISYLFLAMVLLVLSSCSLEDRVVSVTIAASHEKVIVPLHNTIAKWTLELYPTGSEATAEAYLNTAKTPSLRYSQSGQSWEETTVSVRYGHYDFFLKAEDGSENPYAIALGLKENVLVFNGFTVHIAMGDYKPVGVGGTFLVSNIGILAGSSLNDSTLNLVKAELTASNGDVYSTEEGEGKIKMLEFSTNTDGAVRSLGVISSNRLPTGIYGLDITYTFTKGKDTSEKKHYVESVIIRDNQLSSYRLETGESAVVMLSSPAIQIPETWIVIDSSGSATINSQYLENLVGEIVIPSTANGTEITKISDNFLKDNKNVTSVTIPASVEKVGTNAFSGCTNLTEVIIEEGVTSIGSNAFQGCTGLTAIEIPGSVETIGTSSFAGCTSLKEVTIEEGVTSIGSYSFSGCSNVQTIALPSTIESLGELAFNKCTSLSDLSGFSTNEHITTLEKQALNDCNSLTSIILPKDITTIKSGALASCLGLRSLELPSDIEVIWPEGMTRCFNITSLKLNDTNSNDHFKVVNNCVIDNEGCLVAGFFQLDETTKTRYVTIPENEGIKSIGQGALAYLFMTEAFASKTQNNRYNMNMAKTLSLPEGIKTIGSYALEKNDYLEEITLPASLETVCFFAFYANKRLKSINYRGTIASWKEITFLSDTDQSNPLQYGTAPYGKWAFTIHDESKDHFYMAPATYISCTDGRYVFRTGTIGNASYAYTYNDWTTVCDSSNGKISEIAITSGGFEANVVRIAIPSTVTSVGASSFASLAKLEEIVFDGTVSTWNSIVQEGWNTSLKSGVKVLCIDGEV